MNEETQKIEKVKLKPVTNPIGQFAVSPVPKTTTDFPFFYLTKHKERLSKPILYEGVDGEGRPIRWAATPNTAIGSPGIDAHETWTRLVKPTWEAYRTEDDRLPNILPLGGVRQCLRAVGWGQGGWEARRLLRALNQIGATWCTADFSVPTTKLNEDGSPTFRTIKGAFSRLAIYAIGEKHLTEEELNEGKFAFDFNLEDTLYIQFHPFEVAIQESQPQRYLDNDYMFSVRAAARRWYELMAAKIFGVVKNRGAYCEILYSWYVKHHHTLNRLTSRRRIVQQMNEVFREHLDSRFIDRVEYRQVTEIGKPLDFIIRFYPGSAAQDSIRRVSSALQKRRLPPAGAPRAFSRKRIGIRRSIENEQIVEILVAKTNAEGATNATPQAVSKIEGELSPAVRELAEQFFQRGIVRSQAVALLSALPADQLGTVTDYLDYWDSQHQTGRVTPGLLIDLVRKQEPLPATFESRQTRQGRVGAEQRARTMSQVAKLVEERYETFCRAATNRYLAEFPLAELERQVGLYKADLMSEQGILSKPEIAEQFARNATRAKIAAQVALPTPEDFRRQELPRILAELQLDPAEFGIEPLSESDSAGGEPPAALNAPPSNVQSPNGESLNP